MTHVRIEGTGKDGMEWVGVRHASDESRWEKMDMRVYLDRQVISAHWSFTNVSCDFYETELSLETCKQSCSHIHPHTAMYAHIHTHTYSQSYTYTYTHVQTYLRYRYFVGELGFRQISKLTG